uniref:Large ribosomal subunit protein uL4m n=2 Tax=Salmo trutta TaxID=8032 RepID=A0A673WTX0_SALTR
MQLASSFSGENALPANVLIPSNLVDHARAKRPPPPSDSSLPVLRRCDAAVPVHLSPVQTWVETLERRDSKQLGLVDLHPDVFAVPTRGPTSFYYMLPMKVRVQGIKIALSSKLTQDCLHVVDTLNIPTPDPQYLMDLIRYRHWGESVLIVDV